MRRGDHCCAAGDWQTQRTIFEQLIGEVRRKLHLFRRGGPIAYAISGVNIALWDIAGKKAGRPVSDLLGARSESSLPAYASLMKYAESEVLRSQLPAGGRYGL